jgi:hypothetical protein
MTVSAKVVVDLAVTLALGGDCLADLALLRSEPGLYGAAASDATVSRTFTALAADAPAATPVPPPGDDRAHRPAGPPSPRDQTPWVDLVNEGIRRLRALAIPG